MDIQHITPHRGKSAYNFQVTFDDGMVVEVSAPGLFGYRRFQRAVLAQTGCLYECLGIRGRGARAEAWEREIRNHLSEPLT